MQNRALCCTAIIILLVSTAVVSVFATDGSGNEESGQEPLQVTLSDHRNLAARDDIVFIDTSVVDVNNQSFAEYLVDCLNQGMYIVCEEASVFGAVANIKSTSFDSNANAYAMYSPENLNTSFCLSITSNDNEFITDCIADWANQDRQVYDTYYDHNIMCINETIAGGSGSDRGSVKSTTTYYNYNEGDSRYKYYYVNTQFEATANAYWNMCNNVDYIHSECKFQGSADYILMDVEVDRSIRNINQSDIFNAKVDLSYLFPKILTLSPVDAEASLGYYILVDTWHSDANDYVATENHTIGFEFLSPYTIKYQFNLECQAHILPLEP